MNRGEMIFKVQRIFGDTSEVQITKNDIIGWLNDAQIDIARKTECLKKHAETNAISPAGSYDLPDDFIKIQRCTFDGRKLTETDMASMDHYDGDRDTTTPTGVSSRFYTWGKTLTIYPYPAVSGSGNLDIWYVKRPADLDDDTDVSELPIHLHEDMVRYALSRAKELDEEFDQAAKIMADYEVRLVQSKDDTQNQDASSFPSIRSLPGDDW